MVSVGGACRPPAAAATTAAPLPLPRAAASPRRDGLGRQNQMPLLCSPIALAALYKSVCDTPRANRQAGGGEPGLTDSLLETPTYILALVFFIFIALSFIFELVRGAHR